MKRFLENLIWTTKRLKTIDFGSFDSIKPIEESSSGRGDPIDRYYIENFLATNSDLVLGRVLEIGNSEYTTKFGGKRIVKSDVLHFKGNQYSNIIADLTDCPEIETNTYDCIILTQTMQYIFNYKQAVENIHRILKSQGSVLVTVPCTGKSSKTDRNDFGDYWRFTSDSMKKIFSGKFDDFEVKANGNVFAAIAFLEGVSQQDLIDQGKLSFLNYNDPDYEMIITVRATKL